MDLDLVIVDEPAGSNGLKSGKKAQTLFASPVKVQNTKQKKHSADAAIRVRDINTSDNSKNSNHRNTYQFGSTSEVEEENSDVIKSTRLTITSNKSQSASTIPTRLSTTSSSKDSAANGKKERKASGFATPKGDSSTCDSATGEAVFVFGSEDELGKENIQDESLLKVLDLAKTLAKSIDKKYLLKIQKKTELKNHLLLCAAYRKCLLEGQCPNKSAPLNPYKKEIWKKWKEISSCGKMESSDLQNKIMEHTDAAVQIFFTDPDFTALANSNQIILDLRKVLMERKVKDQVMGSRPTIATDESTATTRPNEDDVEAFINIFSNLQTKVTASYIDMMQSLKVRWANSAAVDSVITRENVARQTREDLLNIQDRLVKYQSSIIAYQTDINALWQTMIDHQQMMNNDFQWDFVESVNGDDISTTVLKKGKRPAVHRRVARFISRRFNKKSEPKTRKK